ncbi:hypothetical protein UFOVP431_114 [uncultured Caudovirales phage]|uniref:Uncharacterized protein n=1 Tax=uncultured Caudovirales phage TaxID=2100421 RepID=A0A6J5MN98_9CAUD|nr:hypothetical protein UFOVP431_114 [uncultured Caudovirales phage]
MKATYLDLKTGKTAQDDGLDQWALTEGNWSCDYNRAYRFGLEKEIEQQFGNHCSSQRFIVISVEPEVDDEPFDPAEVIAEANRDYFQKIVDYDERKSG